jgi:hypothetical protein
MSFIGGLPRLAITKLGGDSSKGHGSDRLLSYHHTFIYHRRHRSSDSFRVTRRASWWLHLSLERVTKPTCK